MNLRMPATVAVLAISALCTATSEARSIRVDAGDWDLSGFLSADSNQSLEMFFNALGVSTSTALVTTDGQIVLTGGESLTLKPFFEADQGNVRYEVGTTNEFFNTPGVDEGFRVTWQSFNDAGALLNEYQAAIFSLGGGAQYAIEFNYNLLTAGDNGSEIGYDSSLTGLFDLPGALGLTFDQYMGVGNDIFDDVFCEQGSDVLACNNYFDGVFGPDFTVLPDIANGFFREIDSNGGRSQGRYLFLFQANEREVPEPSTLSLFALSLLALAVFAHRRRLARVASSADRGRR